MYDKNHAFDLGLHWILIVSILYGITRIAMLLLKEYYLGLIHADIKNGVLSRVITKLANYDSDVLWPKYILNKSLNFQQLRQIINFMVGLIRFFMVIWFTQLIAILLIMAVE